jgi:Fe-S-cluster containining protein
MSSRRYDDAKVHLEVFGQTRTIEMQVAVGDCNALDAIPTARAISAEVTAASLEKVAEAGEEVSCRAGCAACCRQLVPIATIEATALRDLLDRMPAERAAVIRKRFATAVEQMERAGLLDKKQPRGRSHLVYADARPGEGNWENVSRRYFALQIACPFLENESCGIYADRPLICREYNVVTPAEYCATLDPRTRAIPWPVRMSEVMAKVGARLAGTSEGSIPFTLALEWAEVHGDAYRHTLEGEEIFGVVVQETADAADAEENRTKSRG